MSSSPARATKQDLLSKKKNWHKYKTTTKKMASKVVAREEVLPAPKHQSQP
jgi:hypothetical protein